MNYSPSYPLTAWQLAASGASQKPISRERLLPRVCTLNIAAKISPTMLYGSRDDIATTCA
jgi:hypothetical protein